MKPGTLLKITTDAYEKPTGFFYVFPFSDEREMETSIDFDPFSVNEKKVPVEDLLMFLGDETQNEIYVLTTQGPGWVYREIVEEI